MDSNSNEDPWLTVAQFAEEADLSETSVRNYLSQDLYGIQEYSKRLYNSRVIHRDFLDRIERLRSAE